MTTATKTRPVYQALASAMVAKRHCENSGSTEWRDRWENLIDRIVSDCLPSGSGWDHGTTNETPVGERGELTKLVFSGSFHHMDEHGGYDGWTDHTITVRPVFGGIDVSVSGKNRNDITEYLAELFYHSLTAECSLEA